MVKTTLLQTYLYTMYMFIILEVIVPLYSVTRHLEILIRFLNNYKNCKSNTYVVYVVFVLKLTVYWGSRIIFKINTLHKIKILLSWKFIKMYRWKTLYLEFRQHFRFFKIKPQKFHFSIFDSQVSEDFQKKLFVSF